MSGQLTVKVHSVSEFPDDVMLSRYRVEDSALDLAEVDLAQLHGALIALLRAPFRGLAGSLLGKFCQFALSPPPQRRVCAAA